MSLRRSLMILAAVLLAHACYYAWPKGLDRQWAFYVLGGVAFAILCLAHLPAKADAASEVGALTATACWWGVLEGLQQAGCGAIGWGGDSQGEDLCIQLVGPVPYLLAAVVFAARFIALQRHRRHPNA